MVFIRFMITSSKQPFLFFLRYEAAMSIAKMSQKFFETRFAIRCVLHRIGFEGTVFELFATISANKAFWMEFVGHGSHCSTSNQFGANKTID